MNMRGYAVQAAGGMVGLFCAVCEVYVPVNALYVVGSTKSQSGFLDPVTLADLLAVATRHNAEHDRT